MDQECDFCGMFLCVFDSWNVYGCCADEIIEQLLCQVSEEP